MGFRSDLPKGIDHAEGYYENLFSSCLIYSITIYCSLKIRILLSIGITSEYLIAKKKKGST